MISPIKNIFVMGIDIFRKIGYFIISGRGKLVLDVSLGGTDIRHLPDVYFIIFFLVLTFESESIILLEMYGKLEVREVAGFYLGSSKVPSSFKFFWKARSGGRGGIKFWFF
jgi:hypothetical protein